VPECEAQVKRARIALSALADRWSEYHALVHECEVHRDPDACEDYPDTLRTVRSLEEDVENALNALVECLLKTRR